MYLRFEISKCALLVLNNVRFSHIKNQLTIQEITRTWKSPLKRFNRFGDQRKERRHSRHAFRVKRREPSAVDIARAPVAQRARYRLVSSATTMIPDQKTRYHKPTMIYNGRIFPVICRPRIGLRRSFWSIPLASKYHTPCRCSKLAGTRNRSKCSGAPMPTSELNKFICRNCRSAMRRTAMRSRLSAQPPPA